MDLEEVDHEDVNLTLLIEIIWGEVKKWSQTLLEESISTFQ